jgi:hypothetical protein
VLLVASGPTSACIEADWLRRSRCSADVMCRGEAEPVSFGWETGGANPRTVGWEGRMGGLDVA